MQKYGIVLGGLEQGYMRRLALHLRSKTEHSIRVEILDEGAMPDDDSDNRRTVYVGSKSFMESLPEKDTAYGITLGTDPTEDAHHLFRYQSADTLYRKILASCRQFDCLPPLSSLQKEKKWLLIAGDVPGSELLAFGAVCASVLGTQGKGLSLLVNLSDISGMSALFDLEKGADMGDLFIRLRKGSPVSPEDYSRSLGVCTDCIMPPENPMVLHEIRADDMQSLLTVLGADGRYSRIIFTLGNTVCGCDQIISLSSRIILLTREGELSGCAAEEWLRLIRRCADPELVRIYRGRLPPLHVPGRYRHLADEWAVCEAGRLARRLLSEENEICEHSPQTGAGNGQTRLAKYQRPDIGADGSLAGFG